MRAARRRQRRPDPLANPRAVRDVLASLKSALPDVILKSEKQVITLLRAARHIQRYSATDTKRGRPGQFDRSLLLKVTSRLGEILERETSSKIGFASFVDHYLRLLYFPSDVVDALSSGDINLFEAAQLARLTSDRLAVSDAEAQRVRRELLRAHLAAHLSATRLRLRVNELLEASVSDRNGEAASAEDLEILDDYDSTHLFWDQLKQLVIALREIKPGDVEDTEIEELLEASEPILTILARIKRRKERKVIKLAI